MITKKIRHLAAVLALGASQALASGGDASVVGAFDAYRAGDAMRLARHAARLDQHLLSPWVDYWALSLRLEDAQAPEVRAFLKAHENAFVSELLRGEWLKVLGKRADWQEFERERGRYARDDLEIRCYGFLSRLARNDRTAFAEARDLWLEPRALPPGCNTLADVLWKHKHLQVGDVWQRVRVLFQHGQITAAKDALGYLPKAEAPDERLLAEAARQPRRALQRLPANMNRRANREVVVLAVIRYARTDPEGAAAALEGPLAKRLPVEDRRYLWGRVGHEAARRHHGNALEWYALAGDVELDDEQLAWQVRAALRHGHWPTVRDAIDRMSPNGRRDPAWTYWYARALAAQGENAGARAYYLRVAGEPHFYGLLANEELGNVFSLPEVNHSPSDEDVAQAARRPGIARAKELMRLGMRTEGVREWLFSIRHLNDDELLAAAELAHRAGIYDRAIHTADRTVSKHNFGLRYPAPFQSVFREYAQSHGLDEAWVLGLVRQESRFIVDARSSAGAAGLMQLMPRTAKYVASRIGMRNYRPRDVTEVSTNVELGTGYLKMVLDQLGHPVLASAAYNAGPSRARRWRDARPMEGAIYAETIPFGETRDYVKRVMANAVFYSAVLNEHPTSLKARLGTIPAPGAVEPIAEDDLP